MGVVDDTIDSTSSVSCVKLGQFISSLAYAILPTFNLNSFMQDFASVILKNGVGTRPITRRQKTKKWSAPRLTRILTVCCGFLANCRGDGIFKDDSPSPSSTNHSSNFATSFSTDSDPPPNDSFCSPENLGTIMTLANASPLSSQSFTNYGATTQPGEPSPQNGWNEPAVQNSVWYQFDVDVNSDVLSVDISHTPCDHYLQFALYKTTGSCSPLGGAADTLNFIKVAADDHSSECYSPKIIKASVSAGNTYLLQVDGFNGESFSGGNITVLASVPLPNDSFCSPENLGTITTLANSRSLSSQSFTNYGATTQPGEPSPQDGWNEPDVQNSVWYQFDVDVNSDVSFVDISHTSTPCTYNLQFALYETTGSCSPLGGADTLNFTEVAADDHSSECYSAKIINAPVSAGNTYLLQVDGFNGENFSGDSINVLAIFPPPNDSFCAPENLGTFTTLATARSLSSQSFTNYGATTQPGEPSPQDGWYDDDRAVQNSVWYQFDVDVNSDVAFVDISHTERCNHNLQFALYETTGSCSPLGGADTLNFIEVAADDHSSECYSAKIINAPVSAGNTYLLQVDGFNGLIFSGGNINVLGKFPAPNDSFCSPENLGTAARCGVLSSQSFTNFRATVQTGEPSPGTGSVEYDSCSSQDGWCEDDLGVQNSVWYQFDVASDVTSVDIIWNQNVAYENPPDLQFALYKTIGLCSSGGLGSLNFTKIAANDDSGISYAPEITKAPVSAGISYLLQVDGWKGEIHDTYEGFITVRSFCSAQPTFKPTTRPTTFKPTTRAPTSKPTTIKPTTRAPTSKPSKPTTRTPTSKTTSRRPTTRAPTSKPSKPTTRTPTSKPSKPTTRIPTSKPTSRSPTLDPSLIHKVRVQLEGVNYLNLREVRVYDQNNVNRALTMTSYQSSTYPGLGSSLAVDGTLGTFSQTEIDQRK
jgi:hypothetical protein